ncbi:Uu.00g086620.m01.CDS01 [Anthostomella pinea]|uniref:Transcription elongation factor 1 homolog n=1 Tax=Anthostomella pinea TaxID=933095 RepID=A0AAI8VM44_9PEZI|nr:Uu.00g086620.m01.CDS01 [Anthostomella pinea]
MGKRKKSTRKPQGPKRNEPLATHFTCLFCNHEKAVTVKMDKKAGVGDLKCTVCGQSYQCGINYLSAPIDVYSEWVDAADAVAKDDMAARAAGKGDSASGHRAGARRPVANRDADDEDDRRYEGDGIVDDDEEY